MNDIEYTDTKYPQNTKSKYDLVSRRLVMNGKPTNKQAISYKGILEMPNCQKQVGK